MQVSLISGENGLLACIRDAHFSAQQLRDCRDYFTQLAHFDVDDFMGAVFVEFDPRVSKVMAMHLLGTIFEQMSEN